MSIISTAKDLYTIALNPSLIHCESSYLFIFSHMRSRSSVLSHVLGSNPDICGYSELHSAYSTRLDLLKMRAKLRRDLKCELEGKYLLDKILHNYTISDQTLETIKPKIIFLLRNPSSTIKSIINMGHTTGVDWYKDAEQATGYYCARLQQLEKHAEKSRNNFFFIDSDELINNTHNVLTSLTNWLGLNTPLSESYSTFKNTGKSGRGDISQHIASGIIKKTEEHKNIIIADELLKKVELCHIKCKEKLLKYAQISNST